jgi:hypothetical protein
MHSERRSEQSSHQAPNHAANEQHGDFHDANNTVDNVDAYMSMIDRAVLQANVQSTACPYHGPYINLQPATGSPQQLTALERYVSEGPGQQSTVVVHVDGTVTSTLKGCLCGQILEAAFQAANGSA